MYLTSPLFLFLFLPLFTLVYLVSTQRIRLPLVVVAGIIFLTLGQITTLWRLTGILIAAYTLGLAISQVKKNGHSEKGLTWLGV